MIKRGKMHEITAIAEYCKRLELFVTLQVDACWGSILAAGSARNAVLHVETIDGCITSVVPAHFDKPSVEDAQMETKPPVPPFTQETAVQKVRFAEDAWNTRDPARVVLAYTEDTRWRNRAEFPAGREQIRGFLERKWARELDYRLIKELWAFTDDRIAVRFAYEWRDDSGHWFRSYGNENWEFTAQGLMARRYASINDLPITETERKYFWPLGRRPDDHPSLSELGL